MKTEVRSVWNYGYVIKTENTNGNAPIFHAMIFNKQVGTQNFINEQDAIDVLKAELKIRDIATEGEHKSQYNAEMRGY